MIWSLNLSVVFCNTRKPLCYLLSHQVRGARGPIFEDGPNFDMAFKLFHGKDGVVPLSGRSSFHNENLVPEPVALFNPLAAKAATMSLSAFGPGGPFSFDFFSEKWKNQKRKSESSNKKQSSSKVHNLYFLGPSILFNLEKCSHFSGKSKNSCKWCL